MWERERPIDPPEYRERHEEDEDSRRDRLRDEELEGYDHLADYYGEPDESHLYVGHEIDEEEE